MASACGDDDSDSGEAADSSSDSSDDSADDSEDVVEATQDGSVLAAVVARGELNCGVSGAGVGFSVTQPDGSQVGFDADYCRDRCRHPRRRGRRELRAAHRRRALHRRPDRPGRRAVPQHDLDPEP